MYKCVKCGRVFYQKEEARKHVKTEHPEIVQHILSRLRHTEIENLRKRNINPEDWAAGYFLSFAEEKEQ